jgi:hypothetical protein
MSCLTAIATGDTQAMPPVRTYGKGQEAGFSVEHLAYSLVPGKIDLKIFKALLYQGIERNNWVVKADIFQLSELHEAGPKFTLESLSRLKKRNLIFTVHEGPSFALFLVPTLKTLVFDLSDPFGKGIPQIKVPTQIKRKRGF